MRTSQTIRVAVISALAVGVTGSVATAAVRSSQPPAPVPGAHAAKDAVSARTAAPASVRQDLFTPIKPCRAVKTASVPQAPRSFYVAGTTGFLPQGGKSGGCGIPTYATAVSATVTSLGSKANGHLALFARGASAPSTIALSYRKGQTISTGTTAVLTPGSGKQLSLKASAKTGVILDVLGYYSPQLYGTFTDTGALYNGNGSLAANSHSSTGYYTLHADRDLTGCTPVITSYYYSYIASGYTSGSYVYVQFTTNAGVAADYYFNVQVTC